MEKLKENKKPSDRVKTSLYIDNELLIKLKVYAAQKEMKVNDILINYVRSLVEWEKSYQEKKC